MVEIALFFAAGFLVATLIALFALPYLTGQAARSAVRKIQENMPFTAAEMAAEKDQLRAEHAVILRKLEMQLERQSAKISAQNIELNDAREKFDTASKITKAGKLALDETRSKEIDLNNRLRQRDAQYAALEQRSRRILRENRDLKLALRKEEKNISETGEPAQVLQGNEAPSPPANALPIADHSFAADRARAVSPSTIGETAIALAKERTRNALLHRQIGELQKRLESAMNTARGAPEKAPRLPKAKLPSILSGKKPIPGQPLERQEMSALQDQLLNIAAEMAHITATLEGEQSPIRAILEKSGDSNPDSLSARMKALINAAKMTMPPEPQPTSIEPVKKPVRLPKAKGLADVM